MVRNGTFLSVRDVLAPGGAIAKRLAGFERRPQQVEMACAVRESLFGGRGPHFAKGRKTGSRHLIVEAGTGIGKSFAYLVPAIELVLRGAGKVLISTFTITLPMEPRS